MELSKILYKSLRVQHSRNLNDVSDIPRCYKTISGCCYLTIVVPIRHEDKQTKLHLSIDNVIPRDNINCERYLLTKYRFL